MARFEYVLKTEQSGFAERLKMGFRERRVIADRATRRIKLPFSVTRKTMGEVGDGRKRRCSI